MAKIILTMNGAVVRKMILLKGRTTIGRHPQNNIVLDDLAISGQHAAIVTADNDSYLEDLNSTNGTQVNGQPVRKHFLQDDDVIELARYRIRYLVDFQVEPESRRSGSAKGPMIRVLNGANAGTKTPLTMPLTTIGQPGMQTAVIACRADGFYLNHVQGRDLPFVNGSSISAQGQRLIPGDLIDLAGVRIEFLAG
ncbi:MAG TPA: FHA domain-containing protein [Noviherbaspirillum sp.]|nr:FHA domain-containing protein [Noviherbaspirillum sp.]